MKEIRVVLVFLLITGGSVMKGWSQIFIGATEVDTSSVVKGLDTPWEILWGPDDHIWLTERYGRISRLNPETGELTELLTIPEVYETSESGLLGMVLHPDFTNHPYVYVVYTYQESSILERLVRYTFTEGILTSPLILLDNIGGASTHDGSRLLIDADNKLYMTTGDARNTSASQDLSSLNGKILRLNLDGSVPDDNPFPGSYIWSWGHRNAQGLVISPQGIMYSSEHGPSSDDELNIIEKARNYGWPDVMGFCDEPGELTFCADSNVMEPIAAWTPTLAVAGTDFYHHPAIPEWQNTLLVSSLKASSLTALNLSPDGRSVSREESYFTNWFGRLRDVCISPDGRVFLAVSNRDGRGTVRPGDDRIVEISPLQNNEYCVQHQNESICYGDNYNFLGRELNQAGLYSDTVISASGCDTIIWLQLNYYAPQSILPDDSLMMNQDETLTLFANEGFVSYMWNNDPLLNDNELPIKGSELGEGFFHYTIEVETDQGCILRDTVTVIVSAVTGLRSKSTLNVSLFPNPVTGNEVQLQYILESEAELRIYSLAGVELAQYLLSPGDRQINITLPQGSGLFSLLITNREGTRVFRVLKL